MFRFTDYSSVITIWLLSSFCNNFFFQLLYFSILKLPFDTSSYLVFLCWDFCFSIFPQVFAVVCWSICVSIALKSEIISASVSSWYQPLLVCLFSCNLKCSQCFLCLVILDGILDIFNVMRHLHLFKSCFRECWYFDGSGQTTLLGSCYSFNLPSGCWGSNADKSSKPLQCYSDLSHMCITQWSGCVFSSQCLRHPDWDHIHRSEGEPRLS